ncbi:unnamed protein product [Blepharisma stoltei]|uniref:Uncharacterized protein n=1 Tax=Blepharisma stoltei TaxID=1481888 RepID=A0AAU9KD82_9CILI|nr:unnamed protein product [Blepharisma stoltei]
MGCNDSQMEEHNIIITNPPTKSYKIIIIGNKAVGKTSIINRIMWNTYDSKIQPSYSNACSYKRVSLSTGESLNLDIWDITKDADFKIHLSNAKFGILVIDTTSEESITNSVHWADELAQNQVKFCIAANKVDKFNKNLVKEIRSIANDYKCLMIESSAKTGYGINTILDIIVLNLLNSRLL